jgi:hypothetical protein
MEEFKDVKGFEGLYQVSNQGRLFKCEKGARGKQVGVSRTDGLHNYTHTILYKDGHRHEATIHRLVAVAFVPNPENRPCVNHKDGNKHNNTAENLEWVSHSENSQHAVDNGFYNTNKITMTMEQFSFQKGWSQVQNKDVRAVKEKIMSALGIKTRVSWYQRLYGNIEPRISEVQAIESIFAEYGIIEIWGAA